MTECQNHLQHMLKGNLMCLQRHHDDLEQRYFEVLPIALQGTSAAHTKSGADGKVPHLLWSANILSYQYFYEVANC